MKLFRGLFSYVAVSLMMGCCINSSHVPIDKLSNPAPVEIKHKNLVDKIENLTVGLIREDSEGDSYVYCAGVWVAKGYILTAGHCVLSVNPALMQYKILNEDNEKIVRYATTKSIDIANDIALIKVSSESEPKHENIVFLNSGQVKPGDEVGIVGHPVGYEWSYIRGYVSAIRTNFSGPVGIMEKLIQISSPAWMGNSGGGAFDENGNFVGLCSWVSKQGPFLSFFVHRDVIRNFLKKEGILRES